MDIRVLNWLRQNIGRTFSSPRKEVYKRSARALPLKLVAVHEKDEAVKIDFIGGKSKAQRARHKSTRNKIHSLPNSITR